MKNHIKNKDKISKNTVRTEKKILGSVLLISVLCIMSASALMINDAGTSDAAGEVGYEFTVGDITYEITETTPNKTVKLTKCNNPGIIGPITIDTVTDNSIEYTITSIGEEAFSGCTGLTSVTISDSVTSIGYAAFSGCTGLTSMTIPYDVLYIGSYAFEGCTGLTSISVDEGNEDYSSADGVLYNKGKTTLIQYPAKKTGTSYTIPTTVTTIGSSAFYGCTGLTSVTIPDSVTVIEYSVFEGCTGLKSLTIPDGVTAIYSYAFYGCTGLTSMTIPDSVTSIGSSAFKGCTGLTSMTIPVNVTIISDYMFRDCTGLISVTIPDSVTVIESFVFEGCTGLTSISVGDGNANYSSADGVLYNKGKTTIMHYPAGKEGSFTIPTTVTTIGNSVFQDCTGLTSVTIPDSVTFIGLSAFQDCTGLTSISVGDGNANYSSAEGALYNKDKTTLILYPAGKEGSFTIPTTVTTIDFDAFQDCTGLTSVTIPVSVITIKDSAFEGCTGLTRITFEGTSTNNFGYDSFALGTEFKSVKCDVYSLMEGKFLDYNKNEYTTFAYFDKSAVPGETDDNNTMLYVVIAVVIAIAIFAAAFVLVRRKQESLRKP